MAAENVNTPLQEEVVNKDALLRKYDRESATRIWSGKAKIIVSIVSAVFSLYCIYMTLFSTAALEVRLTSFLAFVTVIGYLTYPADKKHVKENFIPWYDIVLMILGAGAFLYYCFNYGTLAHTLTSAAKMTPLLITVGVVAILITAELCRRCVGIPILVVVGLLMVYTFINISGNGQSVKEVMGRALYTLFFSTSGILATPVQVCLKFIAVFIIFGAFLERTGISDFFISLANSIVGGASGGPAKVAVVSSALCGMVSGSSVGNTVTTGSITIPMMKRTGYKPEFAGAVEASASTGGQIMPPIMGAAAFLMAEAMGITYGKVALYAVLPAILYFAGIFIAVHLEAKKLGLKGLPKDQLPKFLKLQKDVYLLIPVILLVLIVSMNLKSPQYAAALAILAAIVVAIPGNIMKALSYGEGEAKPTGGKVVGKTLKSMGQMIFSSLEAGGRGCITVVIACCMAGLISGCITTTGLASNLVSAVIKVSSKIPNPTISILVSLFLTMLCCIILGMGVPTTANYCIMASTCAPILIAMGVNKIAAHFFVFYFGIVADITPPVALAAYAGSAIAKSDPMKTGLNATKLAIAAFIVPYIFAINPAMLLMNEGFFEAVLVIITSILGIFAVASALNGYLFKKIPWYARILFIIGGLTLLIPGWLTDIIGIGILAIVIAFQYLSAKKAKN